MVDTYLYMPKVYRLMFGDRDSFVSGQRSSICDMYYCKGRFGERSFEKDKVTGEWGFVKTKSSKARQILKDVAEARKELNRIQDIYVKMGPDPKLYNGNYEFQINTEMDEGRIFYHLWGYRTRKQYQGYSFKDICMRYRIDLELKVFKGIV